VIGRTPYTRFSSSGGGSLPGFEPGDYDLRQLLFETAVHYAVSAGSRNCTGSASKTATPER
jgi:hypothetical protein